MGHLILLGPQRYRTTVVDVVRENGLEGRLAAITAGWQEREEEMDEFDAIIGRKVLNLRLHHRVEEIFSQEPEFREAHRTHQNTLKRLQEIYRLRLSNVQGAVERLMKRKNRFPTELIEPEIAHALELMRELDTHHLERIREQNQRFLETWWAQHGARIMDHHYELAELLEGCSAVLIAGGHVAVLLNRLRILKMDTLLQDKFIVAWSAGAMTLADKIVLFHDTPPQGRGYAEVLETGLGLFPGTVPLPHAKKRLLLDDPIRVAMLAGRFPGEVCITLDDGSRVTWDGTRWCEHSGISRLFEDGRVEEWLA